MRENPMMKCGHAANGYIGDTNEPVCVICCGIHPGAAVVDEAPPDLEGRVARCSYWGKRPSGRNHSSDDCKRGEICSCTRQSSPDLAFFMHHPNREYDEYYCGCWGWE